MMPSTNSYQFPPGFRFHPSDEELIVHYLQNKASSRPLPASIIADIDLYKYNPWELPKKALFGDDEWFFFSPRERKYPNGARPNRSAGLGYWKATGTDRPILTSSGCISVGVKKSLVFYKGRPPKGVKTEWVMNEYRLLDTTIKPSRSKGCMRLDDWVLCRVRHKGNEVLTKTCVVLDRSNEVSASYLPKAGEAVQATYCSYKNEMIRDCLNKSCPILASILASQTLSPETISSFGPVKRTPNYEYSHNNLLSPNKKLNPGSTKTKDFLPAGESLPTNDLSLYNEYQAQYSFYNSDPSDAIIGFLEVDKLDFISGLGVGSLTVD